MQRTLRKPFPTHIFLFLLPAIIIYTLFMIYPLFDSLLSPYWRIFDNFLNGIALGSIIQPWLGSEVTELPTISLISVWQWVGLPMVLFMAALVSIPEELLEAARVDGASPWRVFTEIKFPLVLPTMVLV